MVAEHATRPDRDSRETLWRELRGVARITFQNPETGSPVARLAPDQRSGLPRCLIQWVASVCTTDATRNSAPKLGTTKEAADDGEVVRTADPAMQWRRVSGRLV